MWAWVLPSSSLSYGPLTLTALCGGATASTLPRTVAAGGLRGGDQQAPRAPARAPYPLRLSRQAPWMQGLLSHSLTSDRHVGSW